MNTTNILDILEKFFGYLVVGSLVGILHLLAMFAIWMILILIISSINPDFYPNHSWGIPVTLTTGGILTICFLWSPTKKAFLAITK